MDFGHRFSQMKHNRDSHRDGAGTRSRDGCATMGAGPRNAGVDPGAPGYKVLPGPGTGAL